MTDTTAGEGVTPCPFCAGGATVSFGEHAFHDAVVRCLSCYAEGGVFDVDDGQADERGRNEIAATAAWNTRAAQPSAGAQGEALWAMHIRGPDDLYPAPDYDTAVKWCDYVNYSAAPRSPDVMMAAVPAIWPYAPERHQDGLAGSVADWTLPLKADGTEQVIKPLYATPAQPDTGDVAALREARTYALEMTKKHGNPDGTDYEQGQNDMGFRWVSQLDTMIAALSKPNAPGETVR